VHDLIPLTHPQYCRQGEGGRHAARMRTALTIASGIIVNSRDTQGALQAYAAKAGLACPPTLVAPLASSLPHAPDGGPRPIAEPYFVMLGTIEPRKNHRLLLELWLRLAGKLGARAPKLLVVGQRGWECENVVDMLEHSAPLRGLVIERSSCADAELVAALRHARALLLPSFAEGYGIPVAEALSLGVPVIASDLAVFREFAGDVPEYLDPRAAERWMEAIVDYADDASPRRAAQLERLARFRAPTWGAHLQAVEGFLGEL
jgi:glycosyltransferase involved in cell wall biosynthesis